MSEASEQNKEIYEDRIEKLERLRSAVLKLFECTGKGWVSD